MSEKTCGTNTHCQSCSSAGTCSAEEKERHAQQLIDNTLKNIKHTFMVLSGKGGVGKSSVSVNLAATLAEQGKVVGILDADIHGPNIPKMLGVEERRPCAAPGPVDGILPIEVGSNLRVMSIGFFLNREEDAIIWRGPMKHGLMKQFLGEVQWGALDYLVIDLPPGTGDEALSIAHLIKKVHGALIVTTPQDVALLDSKKSISFCRELKIPLIAVVENMSGMRCPHCNKEINLFKVGGGERIAKKMKVPFLGRVPLDPAMVLCTDEGRPFVIAHPDSPVAEAFRSIAHAWKKLLNDSNR
ncbi:MAG: Mrp/NBP35 family ATP-binding protein [Desulfobacterota bacterium]|nr:Mrp/NBP35 family ATP-binding protein [Thermodesulfobacteriota bacterium]